MLPIQCAVDFWPECPCALACTRQRAHRSAQAVAVTTNGAVDGHAAYFVVRSGWGEADVLRIQVAARSVKSHTVVVCRRLKVKMRDRFAR